MTPQLSIQDVSVSYFGNQEERVLLDQVSLTLQKGEILGLVGESGSGKSLLCRTVLGLLPSRKLHVTGGSVLLDGEDIIAHGAMESIRGRKIGVIFQNPTSHLDPVMKIGKQIREGLIQHRVALSKDAKEKAIRLLEDVGFADPVRAYSSYAHQLSGGMRQRAMIAIALSCNPEILIADEPTTALDVTIQAHILRLLMDIRSKRGLSIILITHDLGVVAQTCDRIAVMREGRIVEQGEKRTLLSNPNHSYTKQLIASHPSLAHVDTHHATHRNRAPVFEVNDLEVRFPIGGNFFQGKKELRALKGVSFQIWPGETIGIVGESGSGKSTLARTMLGLNAVTSGEIKFDGMSLTRERIAAFKHLRSETAMVFQDPFNSLNPRMTIADTLAEVLHTQGKIPSGHISERILELLDLVGLERNFADRRPRTMSGGQCQRAGIARALAVNPRIIVADECVAALDVTIQAQIVDLFKRLTADTGLTLIFIAHDLAIVRNLCERVIVMHHGEIVEDGTTVQVFDQPANPYTASLIAAIPDIDPDRPFINSPLTLSQQEKVS